MHLVYVLNESAKPVVGDPRLLVEPNIAELVRPRNLRHKFQSIAVHHGESLALATRRGTWLEIAVHSESLVLHPLSEPWPHPSKQFFTPVDRSGQVGYKLQAAKWEDGSEAYLDSRGMLHLKSSDRAIPELTLVLADGEMAGWTSDGDRFGPTYFTGVEPTLSGIAVMEKILRPFVARLT
jgi:hypothetical protein